MAYSLEALIGPSLGPRPGLPPLTVVALPQDLGLLPLVGGLLKMLRPLAPADAPPRLDYPAPEVVWLAARLSAGGRVVYVEAEFFGGVGEQYSVGWEGGAVAWGPLAAPDAINQALRWLGVTVEPDAPDEFDTLGLGRHRFTERWLNPDP